MKNLKITIQDKFKCFDCEQNIPVNFSTYDVNDLNLDATRTNHESI